MKQQNNLTNEQKANKLWTVVSYALHNTNRYSLVTSSLKARLRHQVMATGCRPI